MLVLALGVFLHRQGGNPTGRSKVSSEDGNLIERGDKKSVLLSGFIVKILSKLENLLFEQFSFVEAIYICIDLSERGHRIVA